MHRKEWSHPPESNRRPADYELTGHSSLAFTLDFYSHVLHPRPVYGSSNGQSACSVRQSGHQCAFRRSRKRFRGGIRSSFRADGDHYRSEATRMSMLSSSGTTAVRLRLRSRIWPSSRSAPLVSISIRLEREELNWGAIRSLSYPVYTCPFVRSPQDYDMERSVREMLSPLGSS